jgi:hypothetical protein
MQPVSTDPYLKNSLIRFLGSGSFHQTRGQPVDSDWRIALLPRRRFSRHCGLSVAWAMESLLV